MNQPRCTGWKKLNITESVNCTAPMFIHGIWSTKCNGLWIAEFAPGTQNVYKEQLFKCLSDFYDSISLCPHISSSFCPVHIIQFNLWCLNFFPARNILCFQQVFLGLWWLGATWYNFCHLKRLIAKRKAVHFCGVVFAISTYLYSAHMELYSWILCRSFKNRAFEWAGTFISGVISLP